MLAEIIGKGPVVFPADLGIGRGLVVLATAEKRQILREGVRLLGRGLEDERPLNKMMDREFVVDPAEDVGRGREEAGFKGHAPGDWVSPSSSRVPVPEWQESSSTSRAHPLGRPEKTFRSSSSTI